MTAFADPLSPPIDPAAAPPALDRAALLEDVRRLSQVSNFKAAAAVALQWAVILLAGGVALWSHHWYVYVAAGLIIATRQHALAVLMHDAAHYRLFTNRFANDFVSDVLMALPLGVCTSLYRRRHLAHHRCLNTPDDPDWAGMQQVEDWRWPKLRWESAKVFARDLLGLNSLATIIVLGNWSPWPRMLGKPQKNGLPMSARILALAFVLAAAALLTVTHGWWAYLFLWVIPSLTFLSAIFRLRSIAEHLGLPNEHELNASRCVRPTWLERLVIAPAGVNYHLEHHLYPGVPWYNLARLHKRLMREPSFSAKAHVTESYMGLARGVLAELMLSAKHDPAKPITTGGTPPPSHASSTDLSAPNAHAWG